MGRLAERAGMSRSSASRFFSGRPLSLGATLRILAALGVTFEEVTAQVEDQP
jgi:transcriptional regulator with XRE-family HTH domain